MSDIYQEHDSSVSLVISEYKDLKKLIPNHYLLRLVKNVNDQGFTPTDEFFKKYNTDKKGVHGNIDLWSNYYNDLKIIVTSELNNIINKEKKNFEKILWDKIKEKGLIGMVRTHITHNVSPLIF